jgi:catechol 2,3-dioxygenase
MESQLAPALPDVAFAPQRLGHANYDVADLDKAIDFFNRVCGLAIVATERVPGVIHAAFFGNGHTHHDVGVVQRASGKTGLNHLGWELLNEVQLVSAYRRAAARQLQFGDLTNRGGLSKSVYIRAVDGTNYQFYADLTFDWRSIFHGGDIDIHRNPIWDPLAEEPSPKSFYNPTPTMKIHGEGLFHPLRIDHATSIIPMSYSPEEFWVGVCGLVRVGPRTANTYRFASASTGKIEVMAVRARGIKSPEHHHLTLHVEDEADLRASIAAAPGKGVTVERVVDEPHKLSAFVRDPDRNLIEFSVPRIGGFDGVLTNLDPFRA